MILSGSHQLICQSGTAVFSGSGSVLAYTGTSVVIGPGGSLYFTSSSALQAAPVNGTQPLALLLVNGGRVQATSTSTVSLSFRFQMNGGELDVTAGTLQLQATAEIANGAVLNIATGSVLTTSSTFKALAGSTIVGGGSLAPANTSVITIAGTYNLQGHLVQNVSGSLVTFQLSAQVQQLQAILSSASNLTFASGASVGSIQSLSVSEGGLARFFAGCVVGNVSSISVTSTTKPSQVILGTSGLVFDGTTLSLSGSSSSISLANNVTFLRVSAIISNGALLGVGTGGLIPAGQIPQFDRIDLYGGIFNASSGVAIHVASMTISGANSLRTGSDTVLVDFLTVTSGLFDGRGTTASLQELTIVGTSSDHIILSQGHTLGAYGGAGVLNGSNVIYGNSSTFLVSSADVTVNGPITFAPSIGASISLTGDSSLIVDAALVGGTFTLSWNTNADSQSEIVVNPGSTLFVGKPLTTSGQISISQNATLVDASNVVLSSGSLLSGEGTLQVQANLSVAGVFDLQGHLVQSTPNSLVTFQNGSQVQSLQASISSTSLLTFALGSVSTTIQSLSAINGGTVLFAAGSTTSNVFDISASGPLSQVVVSSSGVVLSGTDLHLSANATMTFTLSASATLVEVSAFLSDSGRLQIAQGGVAATQAPHFDQLTISGGVLDASSGLALNATAASFTNNGVRLGSDQILVDYLSVESGQFIGAGSTLSTVELAIYGTPANHIVLLGHTLGALDGTGVLNGSNTIISSGGNSTFLISSADVSVSGAITFAVPQQAGALIQLASDSTLRVDAAASTNGIFTLSWPAQTSAQSEIVIGSGSTLLTNSPLYVQGVLRVSGNATLIAGSMITMSSTSLLTGAGELKVSGVMTVYGGFSLAGETLVQSKNSLLLFDTAIPVQSLVLNMDGGSMSATPSTRFGFLHIVSRGASNGPSNTTTSLSLSTRINILAVTLARDFTNMEIGGSMDIGAFGNIDLSHCADCALAISSSRPLSFVNSTLTVADSTLSVDAPSLTMTECNALVSNNATFSVSTGGLNALPVPVSTADPVHFNLISIDTFSNVSLVSPTAISVQDLSLRNAVLSGDSNIIASGLISLGDGSFIASDVATTAQSLTNIPELAKITLSLSSSLSVAGQLSVGQGAQLDISLEATLSLQKSAVVTLGSPSSTITDPVLIRALDENAVFDAASLLSIAGPTVLDAPLTQTSGTIQISSVLTTWESFSCVNGSLSMLSGSLLVAHADISLSNANVTTSPSSAIVSDSQALLSLNNTRVSGSTVLSLADGSSLTLLGTTAINALSLSITNGSLIMLESSRIVRLDLNTTVLTTSAIVTLSDRAFISSSLLVVAGQTSVTATKNATLATTSLTVTSQTASLSFSDSTTLLTTNGALTLTSQASLKLTGSSLLMAINSTLGISGSSLLAMSGSSTLSGSFSSFGVSNSTLSLALARNLTVSSLSIADSTVQGKSASAFAFSATTAFLTRSSVTGVRLNVTKDLSISGGAPLNLTSSILDSQNFARIQSLVIGGQVINRGVMSINVQNAVSSPLASSVLTGTSLINTGMLAVRTKTYTYTNASGVTSTAGVHDVYTRSFTAIGLSLTSLPIPMELASSLSPFVASAFVDPATSAQFRINDPPTVQLNASATMTIIDRVNRASGLNSSDNQMSPIAVLSANVSLAFSTQSSLSILAKYSFIALDVSRIDIPSSIVSITDPQIKLGSEIFSATLVALANPISMQCVIPADIFRQGPKPVLYSVNGTTFIDTQTQTLFLGRSPSVTRSILADDGLSMAVTFEPDTDQSGMPAFTPFSCSRIFDSASMALLRNAMCEFQNNTYMVVRFTSNSTATIGSSLRFSDRAITQNNTYSSFLVAPFTVSQALNPMKPTARLEGPTRLGTCDDGLLDATKSFGGQLRPLNYTWRLMNPSINPLAADTISRLTTPTIWFNGTWDTGLYRIQVNVTNYLLQTDSAEILISKSSEAYPDVNLVGKPKRTVTRPDTNVIVAECLPSKCRPDAKMKFQWFQIGGPAFTLDDKTSKTMGLKIDPLTLEVNTTYTFQGVCWADGLPWVNTSTTAELFVEKSPLFARVRGLNRMTSTALAVTIDASISIDPDQSSGNGTFSWDCSFINGSISAPMPCVGFDLPQQPVLQFPPNTFPFNHTFYFRVFFSKDIRSDNMTGFIEFIPPRVPAIAIEPLGVKKVSPTSKLILNSFLYNNYPANITWTNEEGLLNATAYATPLNQFSIAILPNVLQPGRTYTFKVTAKGEEGTGAAFIYVLVNEPPSGGVCSVTPTNGTALVTQFDIFCKGFLDEDTPITYNLLYRQANSTATVPISGTVFAPVWSLPNLPEPTGDNTNITLVVRATDVFGAVSYTEVPVQVSKMVNVTVPEVVSKGLESIQTALQSNDSASVVYMANSLGTLLNTQSNTTDPQVDTQLRADLLSTVVTAMATMEPTETSIQQTMATILTLFTTSTLSIPMDVQAATADSTAGLITSVPVMTAETLQQVGDAISAVIVQALPAALSSIPQDNTTEYFTLAKDVSQASMTVMDHVISVVLDNTAPGEPEISANTNCIEVVATRDYVSSMTTTYSMPDSSADLTIHDPALTSLIQDTQVVDTKLTSYCRNMFLWTGDQIETSVVQFGLVDATTDAPFLYSPPDMNLLLSAGSFNESDPVALATLSNPFEIDFALSPDLAVFADPDTGFITADPASGDVIAVAGRLSSKAAASAAQQQTQSNPQQIVTTRVSTEFKCSYWNATAEVWRDDMAVLLDRTNKSSLCIFKQPGIYSQRRIQVTTQIVTPINNQVVSTLFLIGKGATPLVLYAVGLWFIMAVAVLVIRVIEVRLKKRKMAMHQSLFSNKLAEDVIGTRPVQTPLKFFDVVKSDIKNKFESAKDLHKYQAGKDTLKYEEFDPYDSEESGGSPSPRPRSTSSTSSMRKVSSAWGQPRNLVHDDEAPSKLAKAIQESWLSRHIVFSILFSRAEQPFNKSARIVFVFTLWFMYALIQQLLFSSDNSQQTMPQMIIKGTVVSLFGVAIQAILLRVVDGLVSVYRRLCENDQVRSLNAEEKAHHPSSSSVLLDQVLGLVDDLKHAEPILQFSSFKYSAPMPPPLNLSNAAARNQAAHADLASLFAAELSPLFDSIDIEGKGYVTRVEVQDFLYGQSTQMSDDEFKTFFASADKDGDGVLSREEFIATFIDATMEHESARSLPPLPLLPPTAASPVHSAASTASLKSTRSKRGNSLLVAALQNQTFKGSDTSATRPSSAASSFALGPWGDHDLESLSDTESVDSNPHTPTLTALAPPTDFTTVLGELDVLENEIVEEEKKQNTGANRVKNFFRDLPTWSRGMLLVISLISAIGFGAFSRIHPSAVALGVLAVNVLGCYKFEYGARLFLCLVSVGVGSVIDVSLGWQYQITVPAALGGIALVSARALWLSEYLLAAFVVLYSTTSLILGWVSLAIYQEPGFKAAVSVLLPLVTYTVFVLWMRFRSHYGGMVSRNVLMTAISSFSVFAVLAVTGTGFADPRRVMDGVLASWAIFLASLLWVVRYAMQYAPRKDKESYKSTISFLVVAIPISTQFISIYLPLADPQSTVGGQASVAVIMVVAAIEGLVLFEPIRVLLLPKLSKLGFVTKAKERFESTFGKAIQDLRKI